MNLEKKITEKKETKESCTEQILAYQNTLRGMQIVIDQLTGRLKVLIAEKEEVDKLRNNKNQINYVVNSLGRIESNLSVVTKNTNTIANKIPDDLGTDWIRQMGKTMPYIIVLLMIVDNIMWFRGVGQINTIFRCLYMIVPMVVLILTMKSRVFKAQDKMVFYVFITSTLSLLAIRVLWDITYVNHMALFPVSLFPLLIVILLRLLIHVGEKNGQ